MPKITIQQNRADPFDQSTAAATAPSTDGERARGALYNLWTETR